MRAFTIVVSAVACLAISSAASAQDKPATRLPEDVVSAWMKAGAQVGWLGHETFGHLMFHDGTDGKAGEVPAFQFPAWKAGVIGTLPVPQHSFGLSLIHTDMADAGLQELAGLKSLQSLNVAFTKVTDAGMKDLAGLTDAEVAQGYVLTCQAVPTSDAIALYYDR